MTDNNNNDIWVFLSHSNKDYEKVRKVRNFLEENGFRPIMLYLRCKEDPSKYDELKQLVFDEIDHRNKFIYCKSPNAERSTWVQEEIKHLHQTNRSYEVINVDLSENDLMGRVNSIKVKSSIYLSYSHNDSIYADKICKRLEKYESYSLFKPFGQTDVKDDLYRLTIQRIENTKRNGFCIVLLSDKSISSSWVEEEISMMLDNNSKKNIIPIAITKNIAETIKNKRRFAALQECNIIDVSCEPEETKVDVAIDMVLERLYTPGDILAMANQFRDGYNGIQDINEAERLYKIFFKLADESDNPIALFTVGKCYEYGFGVDIDYDKAYMYYNLCRIELGADQIIGETSLGNHCLRVHNKKMSDNNH